MHFKAEKIYYVIEFSLIIYVKIAILHPIKKIA